MKRANNNSGRRKLFSWMLGISTILLCGATSAQEKAPIKIGSLWSLTGAAAQYGIAERDAVAILVDDLNKKGGIGGHQIQIVNYDEATNPIEAARGATQLVQQHGVVAVMGASTGSGTLAAAPILARSKVPVIVPNATATITSKEHAFYPWIFRSVVGDNDIVKTIVQQIGASGAKKLAMFHAEDAYGQDALKLISLLAPTLGMEVVATSSSITSATDLSAQATKLRNADPDAVAIVTSSPVLAATFARASKQVGLRASLWGGVGLGNKAFINVAGPAAEGVRAVLLANWDEPPPGLARLGKILMDAGKTPQGIGEPIAANSLMIIVHALAKNPDAKGDALRAAIETACGVKTFAEGEACFSADNHDGVSPVSLVSVVVSDGKFKSAK